jgi:hemerythrin
MAFFTWNETYLIGIYLIDEQHRHLVDLINRLHDAMNSGAAINILGDILQELEVYAKTHFRTEEEYFALYGYPGTEGHRQEHFIFTKKIAEFGVDFSRNRSGLSMEILNYLKNWLSNHILTEDRKFAPFLKSKGLG